MRHLPAAICFWRYSGTEVACSASFWANHVAGATTSNPMMTRENAAARFGLLTLASIHTMQRVEDRRQRTSPDQGWNARLGQAVA